MAISSRKISSFAEKTSLSGDEYLMVAFDNKSYKVKTSLFTSDIISSITQKVNKGDGAESPITITTSGGDTYVFYVKNGQKGSTGDTGKTGPQGLQGNAGIALYNTDAADMILNSLDGKKDGVQLSDSELTTYGLSALQGTILQSQLDLLKEEYITQEEFDERANSNPIGLDANTKYFIIDEEESE